MTADPEVAVVVALRDSGPAGLRSVESLLVQRDVALELVLVDDGSIDATSELLAELAARDSRVQVVRQQAVGLTAALGRGCALARAPWIARHDAGDLSHPERLVRQLRFLREHPEVVLVSCWTACVGPAGEPLYVERKGGEPGVELELAIDGEAGRTVGPTSHGSVVFRRDAYLAAGGYRAEFALGQDWDLWYRLGRVGRFALLGETLYLRQLLPRSLTFAAHDLQTELRELARECARRRATGASERDLLDRAAGLGARFERERGARLERAEALGRYHLGSLLRELGDPRAAGYFAAALRHRPGFARAWVRWAQTVLRGGRGRLPGGFDSPEAARLLAGLADRPGAIG